MASRNDQLDHDDGSNRMRIDSRYKRNASLRRLIKLSSDVQLIYLFVRTIWKLLPFFLIGEGYEWIDIAILVVGIALHAFYRYAFGFGRSQYEKMWAIRAYGVCLVLFTAECFVRFWLYHVLFGPQSIDPEIAEAYPHIPKVIGYYLKLSTKTGSFLLFKAMDFFEKVMDVIGIGAGAVGAFLLKEYMDDKKKAQQEARERFENEKKKE